MNRRRILFISGFVAILVGICIICFIVGRGHTIYFDNKSIDGTAYESYDHIDVYYKDEKITTLAKRERIEFSFTGQKVSFSLSYGKKMLSPSETIDITIDVPYNMDGLVINLPALIEGAEENVYMSEYIPQNNAEDIEEEVPNTDEFAITTEEE